MPLGNGHRLVALEREVAAVRQALNQAAAYRAGERATDGDAGDRLADQMAAMVDRVARQDDVIADLAARLSDALIALDSLGGRQKKQRGRMTRLVAAQRGRSARARADRERIASAELALRRLSNQVDLDAEQGAKSMTALLERIDHAIGRARPT